MVRTCTDPCAPAGASTRQDQTAASPETRRRRMLDGVADIVERMQHSSLDDQRFVEYAVALCTHATVCRLTTGETRGGGRRCRAMAEKLEISADSLRSAVSPGPAA